MAAPLWLGSALGFLKRLWGAAMKALIFFAGVKWQEQRQKKKVQEDKDDARKFRDEARDKSTDDIIDRLAADDPDDGVRDDSEKQV